MFNVTLNALRGAKGVEIRGAVWLTPRSVVKLRFVGKGVRTEETKLAFVTVEDI